MTNFKKDVKSTLLNYKYYQKQALMLRTLTYVIGSYILERGVVHEIKTYSDWTDYPDFTIYVKCQSHYITFPVKSTQKAIKKL